MDEDCNKLVHWLLGEHLDFDFVDEHLLLELQGRVDSDQAGPYLQVGRMKYRAVLVPPVLTLRQSTLDRLRQFASAGGQVVFAGQVAPYIEAQPSDQVTQFAIDPRRPARFRDFQRQ